MIRLLRRLALRFGYNFTLRRMPQYELRRRAAGLPRDMEPEFVDLQTACGRYTMTSPERMYALWQGVGHVLRHEVPGDLVECGVWRGGSAMLMARTLVAAGDRERRLWLYDTFAGMTRPEAVDVRLRDGSDTVSTWQQMQRDGHNEWARAGLDEVRANMATTGLGAGRIRYVEGDVAETLPAAMPDRIALLRLDTDWYASTRHELEHLFPRLSPGGVLILDDYGSFAGARKAVDGYFADHGIVMLLGRIDSTGRIGIRESRGFSPPGAPGT